jgi:hypothetical protein
MKITAVVATLVFGLVGIATPEAHAQRGARGGGAARAGGGARTSVNHGANVNRNANVNQNVNVNRNVHVDVDRGYGGYGGYHPVARGVAVGATAAVTAAVVGSIVYSLPPSCTAVVTHGVTSQQCGSSWYQPRYYGSQVSYTVVNPPQ